MYLLFKLFSISDCIFIFSHLTFRKDGNRGLRGGDSVGYSSKEHIGRNSVIY